LVEEKDAMQGLNGLKYFSILTAVAMRTSYDLKEGMTWRIIAGVSSGVAIVAATYWDIVIDWGLLQRNSKNPWLRDKLLVSNKSVYFVAMVRVEMTVTKGLCIFIWVVIVVDGRVIIQSSPLSSKNFS
jgi:hypothetical protein